MKVKFKNNENLLKVLKTVENILKKNKAETKLKYVKFENINNKLCISCRNVSMILSYMVQDTIQIKGDAVLYDYKTLISLLNVLKGEIEINDTKIKNEQCEYDIPYLNSEGYPEEIVPEIINKKELITEEFKDAIAKVLPAVSEEQSMITSGILLDENKLVSCDMNRIFIKELTLEEGTENIVLTKELVNEILRLPFSDKIYISIFGNRIIVEDENIRISSTTFDGKYPKYEAVINNRKVQYSFEFNKNDFERAIRLMTPTLNEFTKKVTLIFNPEKIIIESQDNTKKGKTEIKIDSDIAEFEIKFNAEYLFDMLRANEEENIQIKIFKDWNGVYFGSNKSYQYIMPMKDK